MQKPRSRAVRFLRVLLALVAVGAWLVFGGCGQFVNRGYGPYVTELDGRSELSISTYPAWFPSEDLHIPFVYRRRVSPDSVYVQVFVRDAEKEAGPNPHIDSIRIESLSVQVGNGPRQVLISDLDENFWMQDQPDSTQTGVDLTAIRYIPDMDLSIDIALALNGESYRFRDTMAATERTTTYPLFMDKLR